VPELSDRADERPHETREEAFEVQKCDECHRLEILLQESDLDYLAATNRYNTLLLTGLEKSWAGQALRTAKIANDERQRQFDQHVNNHARPALQMGVGA
jgi:hypothetical protein